MSWIKKIAQGLAYLLLLIVCVAVLLEVIFRILPTTSPIDLEPITSEREILRFKADQTANFSLGVDFYRTVTKRTNNDGFYSDFDYEKEKSPNIVIIGDSFVEATQIETIDTVGEVIKAMDNKQSVYQMGVSGVSLSHYIKMVDYAKRNYLPKHFVILIVGNDFDNSLCDYRIKLGTWCFDENFELKFIPFNGYEGIRRYAKASAFMRFLVFQARIDWRLVMASIGLYTQEIKPVDKYAGNVERFKDQEKLEKSFKVVDRFMEELKKLQITDKVTLVIDADRQDIYNKQRSESYFQKMRGYTISSASSNQIKLIDMAPIFEKDYNANGIKFEFPTDGHWNERAHKLLAEALIGN